MKNWNNIRTLNKGLIAPVTFNLLWLGIWICGHVLAWEINNPVHLMLGLVLIIITTWTYFATKLRCTFLIQGLNLFSLSTFLLMLDELNMPPVSNYTSMELSGVIMIIAFVMMTLGIKQRVSDNNSLLESIIYNANTDFLTKLPNRRSLTKRVPDLIEQSNQEGTQLAFFLLDFDNFKFINDTYGHEFGDMVLVDIARQMNKMFSKDFVFGRLGGDEFLVIQKNVKDEEDVNKTAKKIIQCFEEIRTVDDCSVYMSTSVGISICPKDGTSKTELFRKADIALYNVKNNNKNNYVLYTSNIKTNNDSHDLKVDIIDGLKNNEFEVHFQPIMSLSEKNISSFEALVRWYRPDGVVSPAMFIPIAEMYGIVKDIDFYVLRRVCENYNRFRSHGYRNVSINLSAKTMAKPDLAKEILKLIQEFDVCPTFLTFEITETAIIRNESKTFSNINSIKKLGCKVSLDDFGTGYSSLNHLRNLPVDALKIDKTFVDGIGCNHKDELVIKAVLCLANDLGIETIAEGVEWKEQVDFLHAHGCHKIQGYYYGKPMKLEVILNSNVADIMA